MGKMQQETPMPLSSPSSGVDLRDYPGRKMDPSQVQREMPRRSSEEKNGIVEMPMSLLSSPVSGVTLRDHPGGKMAPNQVQREMSMRLPKRTLHILCFIHVLHVRMGLHEATASACWAPTLLKAIRGTGPVTDAAPSFARGWSA